LFAGRPQVNLAADDLGFADAPLGVPVGTCETGPRLALCVSEETIVPASLTAASQPADGETLRALSLVGRCFVSKRESLTKAVPRV
jgi:hypothetical protein